MPLSAGRQVDPSEYPDAVTNDFTATLPRKDGRSCGTGPTVGHAVRPTSTTRSQVPPSGTVGKTTDLTGRLLRNYLDPLASG